LASATPRKKSPPTRKSVACRGGCLRQVIASNRSHISTCRTGFACPSNSFVGHAIKQLEDGVATSTMTPTTASTTVSRPATAASNKKGLNSTWNSVLGGLIAAV
jgi:hypothetical protein